MGETEPVHARVIYKHRQEYVNTKDGFKRETVTQKIIIFFEQVLNWMKRFAWLVIIGGIFIIVYLEIFEALRKNESLYDPYHILELVLYVSILAIVGVLIKYLVKAIADRDRTLKILHYKHTTSLELTKLEDWDKLTARLVELPSTIAVVEASQLLVQNAISGQWETLATWYAEGFSGSDFYYDCRKCFMVRENVDFSFSPCHHTRTASDTAVKSQEYCLPLIFANSLLALIQFKLKAGEELSPTQKKTFENISPEIALAIKASLDQRSLLEMKATETALAERHSISAYLHDNLSQNLAYLCLKLDQFIAGDEQFSEDGWIELQRMKDAANLSYEIVRGMIETTHPVTTPHFVNLICAYANKVAQRANIEISIDRSGEEVPVLPEVQQIIFYIFQEALSNVEKHARAEKASVLIDWGEDGLTVTVSDNGIGFEPKEVDRTKHFGLEIMQERIDKINGRIDFQSSPDSGTEVTIFVPIVSPQKEEHR